MVSFERDPNVESWAKNDHLGFVIKYIHNGIIRDFWPDFLIRLKNNVTLVLEIKGRDDKQNQTKREYLKEWVDVINEDGKYGTWAQDVAFEPEAVEGIVARHAKTKPSTEHAR